MFRLVKQTQIDRHCSAVCVWLSVCLWRTCLCQKPPRQKKSCDGELLRLHSLHITQLPPYLAIFRSVQLSIFCFPSLQSCLRSNTGPVRELCYNSYRFCYTFCYTVLLFVQHFSWLYRTVLLHNKNILAFFLQWVWLNCRLKYLINRDVEICRLLISILC